MSEELFPRFIASRCVMRKNSYIKSSVAFADYKKFCNQHEVFAMSPHAFSQALQRSGFEKDKRKFGNIYWGLELSDEIESQMVDVRGV